MADFGKIKKGKNRFGAAPDLEEPSGNLDAPETAPAAPVRKSRGKTGRTEPLNFKVSENFKQEFKQTALDNKLKLVELLEVCFTQYQEKIK